MHKLLLVWVVMLSVLSGCATYSPGEMGGDTVDSSDAQYQLGMRYLLGQGVRQNDQLAFAAFHRAALRGNPYAESQLGFLYAAGRGVPRDDVAALKWYQSAANHGLASAKYNVGVMLQQGIGAPSDPQRAKLWFQEAADQGFQPAQQALSK